MILDYSIIIKVTNTEEEVPGEDERMRKCRFEHVVLIDWRREAAKTGAFNAAATC